MCLRLYFKDDMKRIIIILFSCLVMCVTYYLCVNSKPSFHRSYLRYIGEEQPPIIEHYIKNGKFYKICAVFYREDRETNIYDHALYFDLNNPTNVRIKSFNQTVYPSHSDMRSQYTDFKHKQTPPFLICTNFTMTREYKRVMELHSD